jgi:hypothetical protein
MRTISISKAAVVAVGGLLLAACGGGGGGGTSVGTASLRGAVVLRDGTTSNLGGIQVTDTRTGRTVTTTADGGFGFGTVPAGTITLAVRDPLAPKPLVVAQESGPGEGGDGTHDGADDGADHEAGDDAGETHDGQDDGDSHDVGDDDADEEGVHDSDDVECEIEIEHGEISAIRFHHRDGDKMLGIVRLTRAETSDDADVSGSARLESSADGDRLSVRAEHLAFQRSVEAFVIAPDGSEATLGTTFASDGGVAEWEVSTHDGGVLPLGAATAADLVGFRIEVRDGNDGTVLLVGELPELPAGTVGGNDGPGDNALGRALIPAVVAGSGEAHVSLRSCEEQRFEVEVVAAAAGSTIEVWLANPANGGTLEKVGELVVDGEGRAELELGEDGTALPFGVAHAADLAGLAIELRATDGTVLFAGTTPTLVSH